MEGVDKRHGRHAARFYADRFEMLLDRFRRHDGSRWGNTQLEDATNGDASNSYVSGLKHARWNKPGFEQLAAIARAMGFPVTLWELPPEEWDLEIARHERARALPDPDEVARLLERLFLSDVNPATGVPYTSAEVAWRTGGRLSEGEVDRLRRGASVGYTEADLASVGQVFGVGPSYWIGRGGGASIDWDALERHYGEEVVGFIRDSRGFTDEQVSQARSYLRFLKQSGGEPGAEDAPGGR